MREVWKKKGWRVQIHNLGNYNNKNTNRVSKPIVIDQVSVFQAGDIWAWINEISVPYYPGLLSLVATYYTDF